MTTIVTRAGKGSALSFAEADANFTNLNNDKVETSALTAYMPLSGGTFTGGITFSGSSLRIQGDFSNSTLANRVMLQTSISNGGTNVGVVPNGTARVAALSVHNASTPLNTEAAQLYCSDTEVAIKSAKFGTSTSPLPINFHVDGVSRMSISATGRVSISGDQIGIDTTKTPATAGDTGTAGTICWDANYVYVCVATNTWKRAALATW